MSDSSSICTPNIIPVEFKQSGIYGDFSAMINDSKYERSLFLFNDNVEDHETAIRGGGNAVIRPYNRYGKHADYPRSAGIPSGFSRKSGGFASLTLRNRRIIDCAIDEIRELQETHGYDSIYFSSDTSCVKGPPLIGTAIFRIGDDVRRYITDQIYSLGDCESIEDL